MRRYFKPMFLALFWGILAGMLMGMAWSDTRHPWIGLIIGGAIGAFMWLLFGGAFPHDGIVADILCGEKRSEEQKKREHLIED